MHWRRKSNSLADAGSYSPRCSVNLAGRSRSFLQDMRRQYHFTDGGYDLGATLLFLGVMICPWIIVLGICFFYLALVAPAIQ